MATSQSEQPARSTTDQSLRGITLLEGEEVLKNELPSWVNWWKLLVLSGIVLLLGVLVLVGGDLSGAVVLLLIGGLLVGYVNIARKRSRYIVTNQRVKKRVGLARKATGETRIADIRGLSTEQGFLERLVGKGSVLIDSGAAGGKLGIQGVADHEGVANAIRRQQQQIEDQQ